MLGYYTINDQGFVTKTNTKCLLNKGPSRGRFLLQETYSANLQKRVTLFSIEKKPFISIAVHSIRNITQLKHQVKNKSVESLDLRFRALSQ